MTHIKSKILTGLSLSSDLTEVRVKFKSLVTSSPLGNGTKEDQDEESESTTKAHDVQIKGKYRPHKDLSDSMKKLRKFALEALEIEVDSKHISQWTVSDIKIAGDVDKKNSRVIMTLAKTVDWSGKVAQIDTPQITMYPEKDEAGRFFNAEKMSVVIEDVIEEAWSYLNGKTGEDGDQLPLFETAVKMETNFTQ